MIENEYDFPDYEKKILLKNSNCLRFIGCFWYILFTFIIPIPAIYFTYLFCLTSYKTITIKKVIISSEDDPKSENNNFNNSNFYSSNTGLSPSFNNTNNYPNNNNNLEYYPNNNKNIQLTSKNN